MSLLRRRGTVAVSIDDLFTETPRRTNGPAEPDDARRTEDLLRRARAEGEAAAVEARSLRQDAEEHADRVRVDAKVEAGHIVEDAAVWAHTWRNRVRMLSDQLVTSANSAAWRLRKETGTRAREEAQAAARRHVRAETARGDAAAARRRSAAAELLTSSEEVCRSISATGAEVVGLVTDVVGTAGRVRDELSRLTRDAGEGGGP